LVENPISSLIIEKKITAGDEVEVDFDGQQFAFNIKKAVLIEKKKTQGTAKKFLCELCAARFSSEVVPNSTQICSSCGSSKVQEAFETLSSPEQEPAQKQKPPTEPKESPQPSLQKDMNENGPTAQQIQGASV